MKLACADIGEHHASRFRQPASHTDMQEPLGPCALEWRSSSAGPERLRLRKSLA